MLVEAQDSFWSAPREHESGLSAEFFRIFFRGIFGCGTTGARLADEDVRARRRSLLHSVVTTRS
ncbi:MAG: hypothetical protein ACO277_02445, partial [Ilumatobacteraceae bacterium]